jgi:hypothetical protein
MQLTDPPVHMVILLRQDYGFVPVIKKFVVARGGTSGEEDVGVTLGQVVQACAGIMTPASAYSAASGRKKAPCLYGLEAFTGQMYCGCGMKWKGECHCELGFDDVEDVSW